MNEPIWNFPNPISNLEKDAYPNWKIDDENIDSLKPLFEAIIEYVPSPSGSRDNPTQAQVFTLDSDNFVGRIGIGLGYLTVG